MYKLSFFKLPFIFITLFLISSAFIFNIRFGITFLATFHDYKNLWSSLYKLTPYQLLRSIPECLLLFGVSAIAFYRINVHLVTLKNIVLIILNVLIVCTVGYLLSVIADLMFDEILINYIDVDSWLFILVLSIIPDGLFYLCAGLLTYYCIRALNNQFEKSTLVFELNTLNSCKIHFILFLAFFFFILIGFPSFILDILIQQDHYLISIGRHIAFPFICYVLTFCVVIVVCKNTFTQVFMVLQIDRIVKSVVYSNLFIFVFNFTLFSIAERLFDLTVSQTILHDYTALVLKIALPIISFIISCLIVRKVTQYYFYRNTGYSLTL